MTAYLSILVAIVGVVLFFATNNKPSEMGKIMFFAGLLAFLLQTQKTLHF